MDASESNEPAWLSKKLVLAMHAETLQQFGGTTGLRDEGRLESALSRPQNRYTFADPSLFELAAAYCHGIVRNHPFVDGNKNGRFCSRMGIGSIRTRPTWCGSWNEWRPER